MYFKLVKKIPKSQSLKINKSTSMYFLIYSFIIYLILNANLTFPPQPFEKLRKRKIEKSKLNCEECMNKSAINNSVYRPLML